MHTAKNIWKKKFFDEKRKTAPLEEQLNRLRYDFEVQHKAIVDMLESKGIILFFYAVLWFCVCCVGYACCSTGFTGFVTKGQTSIILILTDRDGHKGNKDQDNTPSEKVSSFPHVQCSFVVRIYASHLL